MEIQGLHIPDLLLELLDTGRWPRDSARAWEQNNRPLIPDDRPRRFRRIYLHPPPFHTVAQILAGDGAGFYSQCGALHQLVPERVIEVADFGIGADSPILLEYSVSSSDPRVIYLERRFPRRGNRLTF